MLPCEPFFFNEGLIANYFLSFSFYCNYKMLILTFSRRGSDTEAEAESITIAGELSLMFFLRDEDKKKLSPRDRLS